jgi:hypothetical protein
MKIYLEQYKYIMLIKYNISVYNKLIQLVKSLIKQLITIINLHC